MFTDNALSAVQPVNFHLYDHSIVIRTSIGSKLVAATRHLELRTGWSFTTVGRAGRDRPGRDRPADGAAADGLGTGSRDHYIVVDAEQVAGRLIIGGRCSDGPVAVAWSL